MVLICNTIHIAGKGGRMTQKERLDKIRELLSAKPIVLLKELEQLFPDVTSMTLRRDIDRLELHGELIKVRGGARSMKFLTTSAEDDFGKRLFEATEEKRRIAERALEFVEVGKSVFIDSGTTALHLAELMRDERITVTTTGPHVAIELAKKQKPIVNLVGGMINHENLSVSGMQAIKFIDGINIDTAFVVPSGYSVQCGFSCGNYSECELKRCVIEKARRVIMLMDGGKTEKNLPYTFCKPSELFAVITDRALPEDVTLSFESAGVKIITAK